MRFRVIHRRPIDPGWLPAEPYRVVNLETGDRSEFMISLDEIRRFLAEHGVSADRVEAALEELARKGITEVE